MKENTSIRMNKILIILSAITLAFVGIGAARLLDMGSVSTSDEIQNIVISIICYGLTISSAVLLIINSLKNKVGLNENKLPIILYLLSQAISGFNQFYQNSSFTTLIPFAIVIVTIVFYVLAIKNKKFNMCLLVFLSILAALAFANMWSSATSLGDVTITLALASIICLGKEEKTEWKKIVILDL